MGLSILAITLLISAYGIINSWNVKVTGQEITIKGLSKPVRVMHLSDIHLGHFRGKNFLQKLVNKTNDQKVDAFLSPVICSMEGSIFQKKNWPP